MDFNTTCFNCLDAFVKSTDSKFVTPLTLYSADTMHSTPVLSIHHETVLQFLDIAIEQKRLLIDRETFYICDLSRELSTPYNTLVFQLTGAPLKSKESTTEVMSRYFRYINVDYRLVSRFGKVLGITRQCPYVVGTLAFIPERGATRRHVNWIAGHHIQDVKQHGKETYFNMTAHHELTLQITYTKAQNLIQHTKLLMDSQQRMISEWLEQTSLCTYPDVKHNYLSRQSSHPVFQAALPPLSSWLMTVTYLSARDLLKNSLQESNPLLDEPEEPLDDEEAFTSA